jgi:hypothetical protein
LTNGIILSSYDIYSNLINQGAKLITTYDDDINDEFEKYIDNVDKLLDFVEDHKIFSKVKEKIKIIEDAFTSEIDEKIEEFFYNQEFSDKLEISYDIKDIFKMLKISYQMNVSNCYKLNVTDDLNNLFPFRLRCPEFPPLQIRIGPIVYVTICGAVKFEKKDLFLSEASFDFSIKADIGLDLEGGLYTENPILDVTVSCGCKGNIFEGKVGIKYLINFYKAQLDLNIYTELNINIDFRLFILIKAKILRWSYTLIDKEFPINALDLPAYRLFNNSFNETINLANNDNYYLL